MVKKKGVKKKSRTNAVSKQAVQAKKLVRSNKRKIGVVLKNLVLFALLSLLFFVLFEVSSDPVYQDLFSLISMILGFIAFAFFLVLLIFIKVR